MRMIALTGIIPTCLLAFLSPAAEVEQQSGQASIRLLTVDGSTNRPTPARIEVKGENGRFEIADDALPVGVSLRDDDKPLQVEDPAPYIASLRRRINNIYTQGEQFYSKGECILRLPAGRYEIKAVKGTEYRMASRSVEVRAGRELAVELKLERWADMPAEGWYSADAHLHIPRPIAALNGPLSTWMQAEDLHVANLLQWGHSRHFHNAIQFSHGPSGVYQSGNYILASGQENPRTHFLGHTIMLGTKSPINLSDRYIIYRKAFEEGRRQGTVNGYAHHGVNFHAQNGLALDLPTGLVDFIEVMQCNTADYSVWYLALNSGFRLVPLAGTDYPVFPIPGWDRFYARVEGSYSFEAWLDAVRKGRVFVTNGPVLSFEADGIGMGGELTLRAPGEVWLEGAVRFDPERDDIRKLELIKNGEVFATYPRKADEADIRFRIRHRINRACWLALRASGSRKDATILTQIRRQQAHSGPSGGDGERVVAPALAHSSPVFVSIRGRPTLAESPEGKTAAWAWLARLRDLEDNLRAIRSQELAGHDSNPTMDGVSRDLLQANRPELMEIIRQSERRYLERAKIP